MSVCAVPGDGQTFASTLIEWQRVHGRHSLPWQQTTDPYRVWLSEIMLQQTQVQTVIAFYERFLARFDNVVRLADAHPDDVLALWSGLGYYSRARNLHACAIMIRDVHGGSFPREFALLQKLPGVGPSTAAAIASFCFGEKVSIFDGNVKRVLARWSGFDQDICSAVALRPLKQLAQDCVGDVALASNMPAYTQGLMDLGATVCLPRNAQCHRCPFERSCVAKLKGLQSMLPLKAKKNRRSAERWHFEVFHRYQGGKLEFWLSKRPDSGIWAGLFSPTVRVRDTAQALDLGTDVVSLKSFKHVLTHKDLHISAGLSACPSDQAAMAVGGRWVDADELGSVGIPTAVSEILRDAISLLSPVSE